MSRATKCAIFVLLFAPLAGCATPTKYVVDSTPFCRSVAPVCISKDDVLTEGTATGIEANNLGITRVCKVKKTICKKPDATS